MSCAQPVASAQAIKLLPNKPNKRVFMVPFVSRNNVLVGPSMDGRWRRERSSRKQNRHFQSRRLQQIKSCKTSDFGPIARVRFLRAAALSGFAPRRNQKLG